jgi:hypothetical protein
VQAGAETLYILMPDAGRSATAKQARAASPLYNNPKLKIKIAVNLSPDNPANKNPAHHPNEGTCKQRK